ncbi:MAG TPA: hypothetical protein VFN61_15510 [Acidimicrobiales bacterium]|nr:hypothetical protein [Acidimicrobiales bacterium]
MPVVTGWPLTTAAATLATPGVGLGPATGPVAALTLPDESLAVGAVEIEAVEIEAVAGEAAAGEAAAGEAVAAGAPAGRALDDEALREGSSAGPEPFTEAACAAKAAWTACKLGFERGAGWLLGDAGLAGSPETAAALLMGGRSPAAAIPGKAPALDRA